MALTQSLTEWLQQSRLVVVEVDPAARRLRVREASERCSDLGCRAETLVVTDEGESADLGILNPGDVVKVESGRDGPERIVLLRRAWEEWASPEL